MRLTEARIRNFKGIVDWTLKFQPGFNLLKGENGTGKTSILEALAIGLGAFTGWADPNNTPRFTRYNVCRQYQRQGDGSAAYQYQFPTEVSLTAVFPDEKEPRTWAQRQDSIPDYAGTVGKPDSDEIAALSKNMAYDTTKQLPVLRFQSVKSSRITDKRVHNPSFNELISLFYAYQNEFVHRENYQNEFVHRENHGEFGKSERTDGYNGTLSEPLDERGFLLWCEQMERVCLQKGRKIAEYEAVKRAAAVFMEVMEPGKRYSVFYDNQLSDLMCEDESGVILPIDDLSAGYQSLLWMTLDIAYRMARLNAFLLDRITETPGIVLIDELDLHLHPKWQWRVIEALRKTFPNVQFIAATHAPILFASANDVWLVDVDGPEVKYQWSRYGLDINTAVTAYQGDFDLPERVREIADAVSGAIDREAYPEAKELLEKLEAELTPDGEESDPVETPLLAQLRARYDIETSWPEV